MKKFVIISIVLLLAAGAAFGFSLWHYLDVNRPAVTDNADSKTASQQPSETPGTSDATEAPTANSVADGGLFSANYEKAKTAAAEMTKEELAGQLIVGICSDMEAGAAGLTQYKLAGYLFDSSAFSYKSGEEIKEGLKTLSSGAKTAPILAVQEEGGEKNTVSNNGSFPENNYDSPRNILASGGLQEVEKTELQKATFLHDLGFNLNLAPVVDMPNSYDQIMYTRSLSDDPTVVSDFSRYCAKHVQAKGVSVALKHFPGYGTIPDSAYYEAQSNSTAVIDDRAADVLRKTDYEPFKAGVKDGAHFVMVSNVVVKSLDAAHTAALSKTVHEELRNVVGFEGLIITDVIDDADYSAYADGKNPAVAAVLAGNDLILARDYSAAYTAILAAANDGTLSEELLRETAARVLAYKYTAGIIK